MKPKVVVSDFDGVMTDNRVMVTEDGKEAVLVNRADGMGVEMLREQGIPVVVMSTETNPVVSARAKKLGVPVLQSLNDKERALREYCAGQGIKLCDVLYVGNDINDLSAMKISGYKVVPNDAYKQVKEIADVILTSNGGYGVIREIAELVGEE